MRVETVLGPDVLLLESLSGEEAVSVPFALTLDLVSEDPAIPPEEVLRTPVSLAIPLVDDGEDRVIHGLVRRFYQFGRTERLTSYRAEVVPWLWFLSLSSGCRVFQNLSVPEIVEKVFRDAGYSDFSIKCYRSYPKREYCVQYRETHLNFVSRLLEDEGIFYFFKHSKDRHELILTDSSSAVQPCEGLQTARMAPAAGPWRQRDTVTELHQEHAVYTGKVTLNDYNYLEPFLRLESTVPDEAQPEEAYDYPGGYAARDEGERYARLRLEEQEAMHHVVRGESNISAFQSGCRFDLTEHYRRDANQTYQLLRVQHTGSNGGYRSQDSANFDYRNEFVAIPHNVQFRPPHVAQKPVVHGSQTALVVGKSGEEIWTDKHGRVKVQFYWDREGRKDENSSCWVRVSTAWAGKGWGNLAIPRIGQEVIVDFLEGDPDKPIITGKVYNADQTPPYDPSKGGVVSGLRSNTHKGKGYNEMSMDDTAGKEKITIHAQYDMSTTVEHDDTQRVVSGNRKIDVETGTHTEKIKGDTTITIITGAYKLDVQGNTHTHHVKGNVTENYDANQETHVANNVSIISKNAKITLDAKAEIYLHTGESSLTMKADGTIILSGKKIQITGADEVKVGVGNQNVVFDKQKVATSGAAINSSAVGMHEITGALVKIN